ncbi:MAG: hypothetical protein WBE26_18395 [Phycisphaerae bacterium]
MSLHINSALYMGSVLAALGAGALLVIRPDRAYQAIAVWLLGSFVFIDAYAWYLQGQAAEVLRGKRGYVYPLPLHWIDIVALAAVFVATLFLGTCAGVGDVGYNAALWCFAAYCVLIVVYWVLLGIGPYTESDVWRAFEEARWVIVGGKSVFASLTGLFYGIIALVTIGLSGEPTEQWRLVRLVESDGWVNLIVWLLAAVGFYGWIGPIGGWLRWLFALLVFPALVLFVGAVFRLFT